DTFDIPAPFHPLRGNPKVEFRLARIDPNGNCTDGIERIYTPQTGAFNNYFQMQPNFSWDHTRYMNIYVVNWIDYDNHPVDFSTSYIAPVTGPNAETKYDALLVCYMVLADGFNGVSSGYRGHSLSHEMGHNLSLKHLWGNITGCEDEDDDVTDTPLQMDLNLGCPSFPRITCTNGPAGDMFNNFMDYAECKNMFTQGQSDRIRACLANNEWRASLWTASNLEATGVDASSPICQNSPIADFGFGNYAQWLCAGRPVQFYEASTWNPNSYKWNFTGGIPETSTDSFPTVIFSESGIHTVELIVNNSFGSDTVVKTILIQPAEVYYDTLMTESFEDSSFNQQIPQWTLGGKKWSVTSLAAYSGTHSIQLDSSLKYFSTFFTHIYDLDKIPGTGRTLEFKVALGVSPAGSFVGGLRVTWKRPCAYERFELIGNTEKGVQSGAFHTADALLPASLQTAITNQLFIPNASQWKTITLPIPDSLSGEIQIGFDWGSFTSFNKLKGLYIDDIKVMSLPVGVEEIKSGMDWKVFPNPAFDQLTIELANNTKK
ncbi:MAG: M43 family zinc metalloprotease, partial [Saprospiraceae bacterium]